MKHIISLFLLYASLHADQVILKDATIIKGSIAKVHENTLHIKTKFLGTLKIKVPNIKSYSTIKAVNIEYEDGTRTNKTYDSQKNPKVSKLWSDSRDPDSFANKLKNKIWLDLNKKTGNTITSNLTIGGKVSYLRKEDTTSLSARLIRNKKKKTKTADEKKVNLDYEKRFSSTSHHSWYTRIELLNDQIKDIRLRKTMALGYGYYFLKNDRTKLRARTGILYRKETYEKDSDADNKNIGIDFGLNLDFKITTNIKWYSQATFTPTMEDHSDYRLIHESGISIPLNTEIPMFIKSGLEHKFNSRPAESRLNLDTKYFMRLEIVL
ncbi:MAG: DUF481 domain-containing protein [Lentisphaeraceae bacterium]|nr:DUF481 domain-containing protein [Lentisphaeraceae bacterium]